MNKYKVCKKCGSVFNGGVGNKRTSCVYCNGDLELITTNMSADETYKVIQISEDFNFIKSMMELYDNNIVEYTEKINFLTKPKCPKCGSTSITTGARGVNFTWGLLGASKTVNRCSNCGHTWKPKK